MSIIIVKGKNGVTWEWPKRNRVTIIVTPKLLAEHSAEDSLKAMEPLRKIFKDVHDAMFLDAQADDVSWTLKVPKEEVPNIMNNPLVAKVSLE